MLVLLVPRGLQTYFYISKFSGSFLADTKNSNWDTVAYSMTPGKLRDTDSILATALTSQELLHQETSQSRKAHQYQLLSPVSFFFRVDFVVLQRTLGNLPFTPSNLKPIWWGSGTRGRKISIRQGPKLEQFKLLWWVETLATWGLGNLIWTSCGERLQEPHYAGLWMWMLGKLCPLYFMSYLMPWRSETTALLFCFLMFFSFSFSRGKLITSKYNVI